MPAETHVHRGPIGPDEVWRLVRDALVDVIGVDPAAAEQVGPEDVLADLGVDGAAVLAVVAALEDELGERTVGFAFDDDDLADLVTVGDLVDSVLGGIGGEVPGEAP
jgi:acyl carrier protein